MNSLEGIGYVNDKAALKKVKRVYWDDESKSLVDVNRNPIQLSRSFEDKEQAQAWIGPTHKLLDL